VFAKIRTALIKETAYLNHCSVTGVGAGTDSPNRQLTRTGDVHSKRLSNLRGLFGIFEDTPSPGKYYLPQSALRCFVEPVRQGC
jgi:hypothetical protein